MRSNREGIECWRWFTHEATEAGEGSWDAGLWVDLD